MIFKKIKKSRKFLFLLKCSPFGQRDYWNCRQSQKITEQAGAELGQAQFSYQLDTGLVWDLTHLFAYFLTCMQVFLCACLLACFLTC